MPPKSPFHRSANPLEGVNIQSIPEADIVSPEHSAEIQAPISDKGEVGRPSMAEQLAQLRAKLQVNLETTVSGIETGALPVSEKNKASIHQEFRDKLIALNVEHVETDFGGVDVVDFKKDSPFEVVVENEKKLIPAYKARDMFRDILMQDENYPRGVSNHVLVNYIDPIVVQIKNLTTEIGNETDESSKKTLREKRIFASNSLRLAMQSVLSEPSLYNINYDDFTKKTSELSLPVEEVKNRIRFKQDHPFHVSGRLLPQSEIKKIAATIIDQDCAPFEETPGSKKVSGHIKTFYLEYLLRELREASSLDGENNSVAFRIKEQQSIEEKIAIFLNDLQSEGGVQKYATAILENTVEDLAVDFPRLRLRPSPLIKKDAEACRAFYRNLVGNYTEEQKKELAEKFKYGSVDEGLYDEAGIKQLRHLRAEMDMLMKGAGLSDGHIQQSWAAFFNGVMDTIAKKVSEKIELQKDGARKNKDAIARLQEEVYEAYQQINLGINARIVNPKVYMLRNPLQEDLVQSVSGEVKETEVEDVENLELNLSDPFDREERKLAFKLFHEAHIVQLTNLVDTLGQNVRPTIFASAEYNNFSVATKELSLIIFKSVEDFAQADVDALPQKLDSYFEAYDTLQSYIVDNFMDVEVEEGRILESNN